MKNIIFLNTSNVGSVSDMLIACFWINPLLKMVVYQSCGFYFLKLLSVDNQYLLN